MGLVVVLFVNIISEFFVIIGYIVVKLVNLFLFENDECFVF